MTRKLQIGVMGSAADLRYGKDLERKAEETGMMIAKNGCVMMFGAEKDSDSLSTAACRGAKKKGGMAIGITYGKGLETFDTASADAIVATGLERGGGREMALVFSCDAIICINGGSGTLTEMLVAYQANISIVVLGETGGWSERLANQYIDDRKRLKVEMAPTPEKAVELAIRLAQKNQQANRVSQ